LIGKAEIDNDLAAMIAETSQAEIVSAAAIVSSGVTRAVSGDIFAAPFWNHTNGTAYSIIGNC